MVEHGHRDHTLARSLLDVTGGEGAVAPSPIVAKGAISMKLFRKLTTMSMAFGAAMLAGAGSPTGASAASLPGGTLDPMTIPKYVTPLVIPPVMKNYSGIANKYDIAARQFRQQILPPPLPPTTVWSYGPASDPLPATGVAPAADSQFNYPAYTIETQANIPVEVRWRNELVAVDPATNRPYSEGNPARTYLPHILPVDQTLHWANPARECMDGSTRTDCMGMNPTPYTGPVPLVTHVHGAHVAPHSDGHPEAWWLPKASNIPMGYATEGSLFDDVRGQLPANSGYADYSYRNDQPATTLWYHDHSLGMTRSNVYAGPAGFWLVRGTYTAPDGSTVPDLIDNGTTVVPNDGVLPGPAPVAGETVAELNTTGVPVRNKIREIPVAIQDRSFNADGSLFYPDNRAFFQGLNRPGTAPQFPGAGELRIPFVPEMTSDIAPIWNPEAFFNTLVVNGTTWPTLKVAPALYRLRLLNGCNSRFLNLALFRVNKKQGKPDTLTKELPFFQIGAEQGFLPRVVEVRTGFATPLPGNGTIPLDRLRAASKDQALLLGLAERADVIVDFRGLKSGSVVRMINTAPDAPFGGFPDIPADPATTGQVMEFVVDAALLNAAGSTDTTATDPYSIILKAEPSLPLPTAPSRDVSLNEEESGLVCTATDPAGNLTGIDLGGIPFNPMDPTNICFQAGGIPFAPKAAVLGQVDKTDPLLPVGVPLKWTDGGGLTPVTRTIVLENGKSIDVTVTENPAQGNIEEWNIYNFTVDAHPIHPHLVRFQVVARTPIPGVVPAPAPVGVQPWESGFKDTVIAYPGEITTVRAKFDIPGLYVWHCHIVEHEDNEMMRPYVVEP